jgi:two-component system sensor histidine kinase/response regulator
VEVKTVSKLRILLAEDNPVNRMVTVGMLEKHGHSVTIAEDGRQAIRLLEKQQFDLVLMDVGMPIMDGIKTVKTIRSSSSSFQSIPIIAMTAYPIKTHHAICIEAGMNDYLTKPINSERLLAVVARWTRQEEKCLPAEQRPDTSLEKVIDVDQAVSRMGGDTALFRGALEIFLQDASERVQLLRNAIERTDHESVRKIAHRLGGAASSVAAVGVQAAAGELEKMGEGRNIVGYDRTLTLLQEELEKARGISSKISVLNRA